MIRILVSVAALYGTLVFVSQYKWASEIALSGADMSITYGWLAAICVAGSAFSLGKD